MINTDMTKAMGHSVFDKQKKDDTIALGKSGVHDYNPYNPVYEDQVNPLYYWFQIGVMLETIEHCEMMTVGRYVDYDDDPFDFGRFFDITGPWLK